MLQSFMVRFMQGLHVCHCSGYISDKVFSCSHVCSASLVVRLHCGTFRAYPCQGILNRRLGCEQCFCFQLSKSPGRHGQQP